MFAIDALVCIVWAFGVSYLWFLVSGLLVGGNRVDAEVEIGGLDLPEMGVEVYTGFVRSPELNP
jgi:ammonia channel protein AmtB